MAQINFDARSVQPSTGIQDALPAGWYVATITESEMKPTKDGAGSYLSLTFQIAEPMFAANRKVFGRLNLRNANPTAQEIAYKDLSAICHAVGIMQVQDSSQLHNIPLKIKLKVRAASGDYEASNDISTYKPVSEQVQLASPAAPVAGQQAKPGTFQPPAQQQFQQPQQQWQQPQQQQQAPQQAQQQQWQQPQGQQPWAQQQQAQPQQQQFQQPAQQQMQQPAQQQFQQQQAPQGQQGQQPDWAQQQVVAQQQQAPQQQMQQQQFQQPAGNPAQGVVPPWAQQQQG